MTFYIDSRNIMKPRWLEQNLINTLLLYQADAGAGTVVKNRQY
jgi:hypothetical protein